MTDVRTQAWLDQEDARIANLIRRFGWAIEYIGGDGCTCPGCSGEPDNGPPFAYTVGLFELGHPELLIIGVPEGTAAGVLNDLGKRVRAGNCIVAGELVVFDEWPHRIVAEPVPNPGEIVFSANRHFRRPPERSVPVLQLSYDNKAGRFPWEAGYASPGMQPRPGTPGA